MRKPDARNMEFGQVPLLVRIGEAERLFGVHRCRLMEMVRAGKLRTIRLSPRGQHRFPTYELATALGMADMVPRIAVPVSNDLVRNLENEIRDTVNKAQAAFRHELRMEMDQLRRDMLGMLREVQQPNHPKPPVKNRPLEGWQQAGNIGGY